MQIPRVSRIELDYPIQPVARWGHGRPRHAQLATILEASRPAYERRLGRVVAHRAALHSLPVHESESEPGWINDWLPGLDIAVLHTMIADAPTRRYVEVGSGISTKIARRAARLSGRNVHITSIDPNPRAAVDALCDRVIRRPLEEIDLSTFDALDRDDILFIDGSHRVFTNSDVVVAVLEIFPRLRPGVLIHVHDVTLPLDYPPEWWSRFYSEQYVYGALLLFGQAHFAIEMSNAFVSHDAPLASMLAPLWSGLPKTVQHHGCSLWLRTK